MEALYPDYHTGPFRQLNAGTVAGRASHLLGMTKILRAAVGENFLYDDQRCLLLYYSQNHQYVRVDTKGEVFWTLAACGCTEAQVIAKVDDFSLPPPSCSPCGFKLSNDGNLYAAETNMTPAIAHGPYPSGKLLYGHLANQFFPVGE